MNDYFPDLSFRLRVEASTLTARIPPVSDSCQVVGWCCLLVAQIVQQSNGLFKNKAVRLQIAIIYSVMHARLFRTVKTSRECQNNVFIINLR